MLGRKFVLLLSAAVLTFAGAASAPLSFAGSNKSEELELLDGAAQSKSSSSSIYIVRMLDAPVVAYDGKVKGYSATRVAKGQKLDAEDTRVAKYFGYLTSKHDNALQKVGATKKLYSYGYVFNGFAAELTDAQAAKLKAMSDVVTVWKDEERTLDTNRTPAFLGLSASGGLWDQLGGQSQRRRGHRHRHGRFRVLARKSELLGSERRGQTGLPQHPALEGQVPSRRGLQRFELQQEGHRGALLQHRLRRSTRP